MYIKIKPASESAAEGFYESDCAGIARAMKKRSGQTEDMLRMWNHDDDPDKATEIFLSAGTSIYMMNCTGKTIDTWTAKKY